MTTELGTELGTTLGTVLGTMDVFGAPSFDASKVYALSGFTTSDRYATQVGGGEAGVDTGFGVLALAQLRALTGASACFAVRSDGASDGYFLNINTSNAVNFQARATASFPGSTRFQFTSSDVGKLFFLIGLGSPGFNRIFVARAEMGTGTTRTGFVPNTTLAYNLATLNTSQPATGLGIVAEAAFRGAPTDPQLLAVYDAVRAANDIPSKAAIEALMPGTTVTHRWSLRDVLAALNVPVIDSQAAPATIPDSVTAATVDAMTKTGSPVVRVIDPGVYPQTSYAIMGSAGGSLSATPGWVGSAAGFSAHFLLRVDAQTTALYRMLFASGVKWDVRLTTNNQSLLFTVGSGQSGTYSVSAANVGRWLFCTATFDPAVGPRLFVEAVEAGTTSGPATLAPGTGPFTVGVRSDGYPATETSLGFISGDNSIYTPARILADYQSWLSTRKVPVPSGAGAHLYDLTQDVVANGGPSNGVPAVVLDRVGTDNLTRVGTGLQVSQRTERLWSYETSPILYGASGFSQANYYAASVWNEPAASPWWMAALFTVTSQSVASGNRSIIGNGELVTSTYTGFHLCTAGTNSLCYINLCSAAGSFVSGPVGSIAATDIGKLLLYVGVWDPAAGKIRGYWKRAEIGSGSGSAAYLPSPATPLRLGRSISNADWSAGSIVVHGVSGGFGLPSLAQVQSLFDEAQATERIGSIAGMTNLRIDLTQDALGNGGVLPATLTDRVGSFNFTRTGSITTTPTYARAWNW